MAEFVRLVEKWSQLQDTRRGSDQALEGGSELIESSSRDGAVCIIAFEGWSDASGAATMALRHIADALDAEPLGEIDCEDFIDFSSSRPSVYFDSRQRRCIEWPEGELLIAPANSVRPEVIFLSSPEPQLKWKTYSRQLFEFLVSRNVTNLVTLGSLFDEVHHQASVSLVGLCSDGAALAKLGMVQSRYEGPTGMLGVLHVEASNRSMKTLTAWGVAPNYAMGPSPRVAASLVGCVASLIGVDIPTAILDLANQVYDIEVNELIESDPDLADYVAQLPSGGSSARWYQIAGNSGPADTKEAAERLVVDLENFLRSQG